MIDMHILLMLIMNQIRTVSCNSGSNSSSFFEIESIAILFSDISSLTSSLSPFGKIICRFDFINF